MSFFVRIFLIFVVALFADRLVYGIEFLHYWSFQEPLFSFVVAIINACIRTFTYLIHGSCSWFILGFYGLIVNGIIYGLLAANRLEISGMIAATPGSALAVGVIVWIVALICNHYVVPKK